MRGSALAGRKAGCLHGEAMKTPTLCIRAVITAVAFGFCAGASLHAETTAKPEKPIPAGVLKKFDKDGDGKLDDAEMAAWKAAREAEKKAMMEKYDTNKDGKLDESEKAAMKADKDKEKELKKEQKKKTTD